MIHEHSDTFIESSCQIWGEKKRREKKNNTIRMGTTWPIKLIMTSTIFTNFDAFFFLLQVSILVGAFSLSLILFIKVNRYKNFNLDRSSLLFVDCRVVMVLSWLAINGGYICHGSH